MWNKDIWIGLVTLVLALSGYFIVIPYAVVVPQNLDNIALSPAFWPDIIMLILSLCACIILIQGIIEYRSQHTTTASAANALDRDHKPTGIASRETFILVTLILSFIVYYLLIDWLGIWLSSSLMLFFLMALGSKKPTKKYWIITFLLSTILPSLLYFFFTRVANVYLPQGIFYQYS